MDPLQNGTIRCRDAVYSVQSVIGAGRFSRVYQATDTATNVRVAIKVLAGESCGDRDQSLKELDTLNALKESPVRARFVDVVNAVWLESGEVCLVMERLGTTLQSVLHNVGPLPMSMCRPIVRQIMQGMDDHPTVWCTTLVLLYYNIILWFFGIQFEYFECREFIKN